MDTHIMDTHKRRRVRRSMGALLRWFALSLLFAGTHAFAQTGGTVTYVYTDPQGTPLAETDASGNITATFEYTPYGTYAPQGTPAPGPAPKGPGYTGHVNDPETNLVYMQARYYDPVTGQFISVDPVATTAGDSFKFNRYEYALSNPIKNIDPNGKDPCQACDDISGVSYFAGTQFHTAGIVRQGYIQSSAKLDRTDKAGRSALKEETRANTPSMLRRIIAAMRPSTEPKEGSGGRANVTNEAVNQGAERLRIGGNALLVTGVAVSAYSVATASDKPRALASAGGATLGGIGGGEGGAWVGGALGLSLGGPPGAAVGAVIGGFGMSAVGSHYGAKATTTIYDKVNN